MWCWTFYKVKCDAEHFPLENVMQKCIFAQLNIFLWKMYAKMHLMRTFCYTKCYKCIWCKNAVFFALQKTKMLPLHFVGALPKCILATRTFSKGKCSAYIFLWKMFSVHFPKENVQQTKMLESGKMLCFLLCKKQRLCVAKMHLMQKCILASNAFWQRNATRTFSKGKCSAVQKCCVFCFAKNKDAVQKCIFASHFVLQKCIFASTKCYKCIWCQNAFDAYIL